VSFFIAYPWTALAPAAGCACLWWWRGRPAAAGAAASWAIYALYEAMMRARLLCSGECNIRVDLLLIYPALVALTVIALLRSLRPSRGASTGP
jgi:hypothetical protein